MPAPQYRTYQAPGATAMVSRMTAASDPYPEYSIQAEAHVKAEDGETYHGFIYIGRIVKDYDPYPTVKWFVENDGRFPEKYRTVKELAQIALAEARSSAMLKATIARITKEMRATEIDGKYQDTYFKEETK